MLQPMLKMVHGKTSLLMGSGGGGGGWGKFERAFFDVRVFNPHALTNRQLQLSSCYYHHENTKRRAYEQRIRDIEHSSFVPLVMSVTGGLGRIATTTYK